MTLSPTALEEAAKARIIEQYGEDAEDGFGEHFSELLEAFKQESATAITAYLAQAEKDGWVMVPKVASDKMVCAALDDFEKRAGHQRLTHIYAAMLAAAQNGGE